MTRNRLASLMDKMRVYYRLYMLGQGTGQTHWWHLGQLLRWHACDRFCGVKICCNCICKVQVLYQHQALRESKIWRIAPKMHSMGELLP